MIYMSATNNQLVDLNDVQIDSSLPVNERIASFVQQIGNPYHYKVGEVIVHVSYTPNGKSLDDCFHALLAAD